MKVLAINGGSSSKKYKLFDKDTELVLADIEFRNHAEGEYVMVINGKKHSILKKDYDYSFDTFVETLQNLNIIEKAEEIDAVVHRVIHGGEKYTEITKINDDVLKDIEGFAEFTPLHSPVVLEIIREIKTAYSNINQYAVFDSSFHLTNEKEQYLYGLPYGYYQNLKVRRYGFHGISYQYVYNKLQNQIVNLDDKKIIICHLGSGSSVCAIKNGKSFDHSFGFTPDENLIMATRSGEVDYDAVNYIKKKLGMTDEDIKKLLNQESGLLGISGYTKDMKQLIEDYESNDRAKLAIDMYVNKVIEWVSKFFVSMQGCDALVFTGGIGWRAPVLRKMILEKFEILGIKYSKQKNDSFTGDLEMLDISDEQSSSKVLIMHTDEELQMLKFLEGLGDLNR
jgi:acetate kinase